MIDRENVIKGLECCIMQGVQGIFDCDSDCPYGEHGNRLDCWIKMNRDALAMLEQESVEPIRISTNYEQHWKCGKCNAVISAQDKFCHNCGRSVRWE